MTTATHIKGLIHNGRRWDIVRIKDSYFARCYGQGEYAGRPSDTGPYSTMEQAQEFITAIRNDDASHCSRDTDEVRS